jgi:hypothetical protein
MAPTALGDPYVLVVVDEMRKVCESRRRDRLPDTIHVHHPVAALRAIVAIPISGAVNIQSAERRGAFGAAQSDAVAAHIDGRSRCF